jgi:hypothetical protein
MFFLDNSGRTAELAVNPMTNTARTGAKRDGKILADGLERFFLDCRTGSSTVRSWTKDSRTGNWA